MCKVNKKTRILHKSQAAVQKMFKEQKWVKTIYLAKIEQLATEKQVTQLTKMRQLSPVCLKFTQNEVNFIYCYEVLFLASVKVNTMDVELQN